MRKKSFDKKWENVMVALEESAIQTQRLTRVLIRALTLFEDFMEADAKRDEREVKDVPTL